MWVIFDSIEYKENIKSTRSDKVYSGWEATGIKKGYQGSPDEDWSKVFFDNQTTTIIENGLPNNNQSIVQFFLKAVKKGDTLNIKMERDGTFWRIISIENLNNIKPDYVPLAEKNQTPISAQVNTTSTDVISPTSLPW